MSIKTSVLNLAVRLARDNESQVFNKPESTFKVPVLLVVDIENLADRHKPKALEAFVDAANSFYDNRADVSVVVACSKQNTCLAQKAVAAFDKSVVLVAENGPSAADTALIEYALSAQQQTPMLNVVVCSADGKFAQLSPELVLVSKKQQNSVSKKLKTKAREVIAVEAA